MTRPTTIDYADPAADGRVTILHRPDGTVEVDVPPPGQVPWAVGAAAVGVLVPAGVLEGMHLRTGNGQYAAAAFGSVVVGGIVAAVVTAGLRSIATTRTTLRCAAGELAMEQTALGQDTVRRRWPRARVAAVAPATVRTEDGKRTALQLRLVDPPAVDDLLIGRLTPGELEAIAAAIRQWLGPMTPVVGGLANDAETA